MSRTLITLLLCLALTTVPMLTPKPAYAVYFVDYGDNLSVSVKGADQYNYVGSIRPDGVITIPFLGDVEVAGLTTQQVEQRLVGALRQFLRNPEVSVNVTGYRPQYVTVLGEVRSPGVIPMPRPNATLFDVLAASGGLTDRAVASEVVVFRGNGANAKRFTINVEEMIKNVDFTNNITIEPGDRIQVREVWWPNVAEWRRELATVLSLVASLAALFALYNRASQ
jgi:polysaccharide export outer membrane protein